MSFRFHEVALKPRPNAAPIRELIDYTGFCGQAAAEEAQAAARAAERFARITPQEANERMQGGWEPFVLDVRTAREAEVVSLPRVDAQQPHRQMAGIVETLPRERDILVHCKAGVRSAAACESLVELGLEPARLYSLEGGIVRWAKDVDPSLPLY